MLNSVVRSCMKRNVHTVRKRIAPQVHQRIRVGDLIDTVVRDTKFENAKDWNVIRDQILNASEHVSRNNVDMLTMDYFLKARNYSLGKSYFDFLRQSSFKPNLATTGKYLRLFYFAKKDERISNDEETEILSMYKQVKGKYEVLDTFTSENLALALSNTKEWRLCLELLDEMKLMFSPTAVVYSAIICAALKDKEIDVAWKLLQELIDSDKIPENDVYCRYVEFCVESGNFRKHLTELLDFLQRYDLKLNEEAARKLVDAAKMNNCNANYTRIQTVGTCETCKNKLAFLNVTPDEFENLKKEFFSKAIIGKNVFSKTTPDEVSRFKEFVEKMDRFDVVIDGLNVAYSGGPQPNYITSGFVAAVVNHFVQQNKKVLVCGRLHMKKWPKRNLDFIYSNASVFLTEDLSQDDPYLLYCALSCGLNTAVISKDLMRSHLFLIKNAYHKSVFKRWLSQNLNQISFIDKQGRVTFKPKQQYLPCAQKNGNTWHLPYEIQGTGNNSEDIKTKWICLKL